ncbi:hypothetical protein AB0J94_05595 [Micromonospora noduli]|uniref:hypothetical protein n=1 Tax=Micromonospora noduli TaxID=709876 RepID=UPI00343C7FE3
MTLGEDAKSRRPRRWVLYLAVVLALCAGAPVAVAGTWAAVKTYQAGKGEPTPVAAVDVFMLAMSSGDELGIGGALAPQRYDELLDEWRSIRRDIERTEPAVSKVAAEDFEVDNQDDDRAQVVTQVHGVWFPTDGSGLFIHGTPHPWRFQVRRDAGGWRVWSVDAYPWCGGHVRADACR